MAAGEEASAAFTVHRRFLEAAYCCHDLKDAGTNARSRWIGDPMEQALVGLAARALGEPPACPRIDEIPFEPERKRLVTIHRDAADVVLFIKGAPEEVLPRARSVEVTGRRQPLTAEWSAAFTEAQTQMADRGLRVLAFAYRVLSERYMLEEVEQDLVLTALVGFDDPPRPDVPSAIRRCREAGIKIVMVTGDHPHTAVAIAREVGLVTKDDSRVLTGDELRRLSDTQMQLALDAPEISPGWAGPTSSSAQGTRSPSCEPRSSNLSVD